MAKIWFSTILLFVAVTVHAQYIKLDNGVVLSSLSNKKDLALLNSSVSNYSFLFGTDYLEKNWFYLSSQIGYSKLGGRETNPSLPAEFRSISESRSYLHLNTTFRAYVKYDDLRIFVGIGPYVNFLTGAKNFDSEVYKPYYELQSLHTGGKADIGLTQDANKFRIGVVGTYMYGLTPLAKSDYLSLNNNAFSVMITVGYRIF